MNEWKKVKIGDVFKIEKGSTEIASVSLEDYPLVVTAAEQLETQIQIRQTLAKQLMQGI